MFLIVLIELDQQNLERLVLFSFANSLLLLFSSSMFPKKIVVKKKEEKVSNK